MWHAIFKAIIAVVVALFQIAVVLLSYSHGRDDERHRWRDWLHDRRIPQHHFMVHGIYRPEPWE